VSNLSPAQYPYRSVQIVLRLYQSPAEILAGFDIDAPCCAYDGKYQTNFFITLFLIVIQATASGLILELSSL